MMFRQTEGGEMRNTIMQKIILAKTESFVYRCLSAHAMLDVMCVPEFVGASDII